VVNKATENFAIFCKGQMSVFRKGQPSKLAWTKYQYFKSTKNCKKSICRYVDRSRRKQKTKRRIGSQYDKKHLRRSFTVAACSKQCSDTYVLYVPKFMKRCNETFLTCSSVVTFIRSTAIFKGKPKTIQGDE